MHKLKQNNRYQMLVDDIYLMLLQRQKQWASFFKNEKKLATLKLLFIALEKKLSTSPAPVDFSQITNLLDDSPQNDFSFQDWVAKLDQDEQMAIHNLKMEPAVLNSKGKASLDKDEIKNLFEENYLDINKNKDILFEAQRADKRNAFYKTAMGLVTGFLVISAVGGWLLTSFGSYDVDITDMGVQISDDLQLPKAYSVATLFDEKTRQYLLSETSYKSDVLEQTVDVDTSEIDQIIPNDVQPQQWRLVRLVQRAEQGDMRAQHDLALEYLKGDLAASPDALKYSFELLSKSADQGYASAYYNLGVMYQQGLYVSIDKFEAATLFEQAATLDHGAAHYNLGVMIVNGDVYAGDYKRALNHFKEAYTYGVNQSAMMIAKLYATGVLNYGHARNDLALSWYQKAKDHGVSGADQAIRFLKKKMNKPT